MKEKYRDCPTPGCYGKIRSDEQGRSYNARVDGKIVCAECVINNIYKQYQH